MTTLQLDLPKRGAEQTAKTPHLPPTRKIPTAGPKVVQRAPSPKILRFAKSERVLHWSIAAPFLVSFASAIVLVLIYNPDPSRPYRDIFALLHRVSGAALIILPMMATFKSRGDARVHLYNIRQAWIWVYDDFKWLALMGLAAISSKIKLPEQGKFNAMEKINFMVLMTTYPLYVATGLLMWITNLAVLAWILHCLMAILAAPLIGGHIYMAVVNPATRKGLEGMITGFVDRQWAKHHYRRWYREHHEHTEHSPALEDPVAVPSSSGMSRLPTRPTSYLGEMAIETSCASIENSSSAELTRDNTRRELI